jgi:hypothetical protein
MTHKVLASKIQGRDFQKDVASYLHELTEWKRHETLVKSDDARIAKGEKIDPLQRRRSFPMPSAHPDVVASISADGKIDYEIVDDSPSATEILRQKKDKLLSQVMNAEKEASYSLLHPAKRRLHEIRKREILMLEAPNSKAKKELDERQEIDARLQRIDRIAAQALHDIEDLTTKNIDKWLMPSFEV